MGSLRENFKETKEEVKMLEKNLGDLNKQLTNDKIAEEIKAY